MRLVVVESPYAGRPPAWVPRGLRWLVAARLRRRNVRYAQALVRECVLRGDSPVASHLLFTQPGILRDRVDGERRLGIEAGLAWGRVAEAVVVGIDLGITPGMELGIARHRREGRRVEMLSLPEWKRPRVKR